MKHFRLFNICALLIALSAVISTSVNAHAWFDLPSEYELPPSINPEGITRKGKSATFFVGSLANGGIYQFDAITGDGKFVIQGGENRSAVGMAFDSRSGLLYVAGGATGKVFVYKPSSGELVQELDVGAEGEATLVNDVKITRRAVYITDSFRPVFYRIPLNKYGSLENEPVLKTIPLHGEFEFAEGGAINANGIEAIHSGDILIVVNTQSGRLYRVNGHTGEAKEIALDQSVINGDGLLLLGNKLFVVQNFLNQISVIDLDWNLQSGEVIKVITSEGFDIPTTTANFGFNLLTVNARFSTPEATEFKVNTINLLEEF